MTRITQEEEAARPFRPVSASAFTSYAKSLASLVNEPYQRCLEALARIYGYSGHHEIQVVLAEHARAGVFDGELRYVVDCEIRAARAERTFRVLSELVGPAVSPHEADRLHLAEHLGLFMRPTDHRRRVRVVNAALPLVEAGWGALSAIRLIEGYSPEAYFKASFKLDSQLLQTFDMKVAPLAEAMEAMRCYRAPELYLLDREVDEKTAKVFAERGIDFEPSGDYSRPEEFLYAAAEDFDFGQYVIEVLYPEHAGKEVDESLLEDDELLDALHSFPDKPDPEVAAHHPILMAIPDICELARGWTTFSRARAARAFIDARTPQALLFHESTLRLAGDAESKCFCTVRLSESHGSAEFEDMMLWDYQCTIWVEPTDDGPWVPAAVMTGILIDPYRNRYLVDPENFKWQMDAHSAFLNDVWKVLQFEYFEPNGYASITDYAQAHPWRSFATMNVEVAPAFRGRDLLTCLVQTFVDAAAESCNQFDLNWQDIHEDGLGECEPEFAITPPGVLIFPVEGSRPASNEVPWGNVLLAGSPRKVSQKDIAVDPKVEDTRCKLEARFRSLSGRVILSDPLSGGEEEEPVDILVYNPWDYPIT